MDYRTTPFRPLALALAGALVASACGETPTDVPSDLPVAEAAVGLTSSLKVPLALSVFVACAADGAGEVVSLEGTLHVLNHVTFTDAGTVVFKSHNQPQRVSGVGLSTGDRYQGTGVSQDIEVNHDGGLPYTFTGINNFRIIGQGPGNNYTVHGLTHYTVNANGEVTVMVESNRVDCS